MGNGNSILKSSPFSFNYKGNQKNRVSLQKTMAEAVRTENLLLKATIDRTKLYVLTAEKNKFGFDMPNSYFSGESKLCSSEHIRLTISFFSFFRNAKI